MAVRMSEMDSAMMKMLVGLRRRELRRTAKHTKAFPHNAETSIKTQKNVSVTIVAVLRSACWLVVSNVLDVAFMIDINCAGSLQGLF